MEDLLESYYYNFGYLNLILVLTVTAISMYITYQLFNPLKEKDD